MTGLVWPALALILSTQAPALHHRSAPASVAVATPANARPSSLPPDADGEYQFGETGEVIELYVEDHALRGYLLKRSEHSRSASTPLTFDFVSGSAADGSLSFITRTLHGQFYSFTGSLTRGPATSSSVLGYYLLRGQLVLHTGSAADTRSVVLERLGQHE